MEGTPVVTAQGRQRQEDQEMEASLGCAGNPVSKKTRATTNATRWGKVWRLDRRAHARCRGAERGTGKCQEILTSDSMKNRCAQTGS
jgi:hypothetical protein